MHGESSLEYGEKPYLVQHQNVHLFAVTIEENIQDGIKFEFTKDSFKIFFSQLARQPVCFHDCNKQITLQTLKDAPPHLDPKKLVSQEV